MVKVDGIVNERHAESPAEAAIKQGMSEYSVKKDRLKEMRKKLEDALMQDEDYSNAKNVLSEVSKQKKETRAKIIKEDSDLRVLDQAITKLSDEMKNLQLSIFDNLLDYTNKTGKKVIVDNAGEPHEITVEAKTDL